MSNFKIVAAKISDAPDIHRIYAPYITKTPITFETVVPSVNEIADRIEKVMERYPWIVAIDNNRIIGYAYATQIRTRAAYDWSVETAVYIQEDYTGKGAGTQLYQKLLSVLRQQNYTNASGGVALPNEASVKLHEKLGFSHIGTFKKIGYKFDQWWDVGWWQKELSSSAPRKIKKFVPEMLNQ